MVIVVRDVKDDHCQIPPAHGARFRYWPPTVSDPDRGHERGGGLWARHVTVSPQWRRSSWRTTGPPSLGHHTACPSLPASAAWTVRSPASTERSASTSSHAWSRGGMPP